MPSFAQPCRARISPLCAILAIVCTLFAVPIASADAAEEFGEAASTPLLPPEVPWGGESRSLALPADSDHPFVTHFEQSGLVASPTYDETVEWLRRLVDTAPELRMVSLGTSGEGRDIWMVIASSDGAFTPERIRTSTKPVVLAQAGIHSGEIDGKDAGLMLLRDMTVRGLRGHLLDRVQLLFVPIFNVDGHERRSAHGRINQRGPVEMGWRTNANNLNLNRDYAKADTPEMRAMLRAISAYDPDLYVDLHVTDGIDYQYDITWGYTGPQGGSPSISHWLENVLDPPIVEHLTTEGHDPGYLVFSFDDIEPDQGLFKWSASSPRFSDGYGGLRRLPTILVENHSLDPYDRRVLGTYLFLEALLDTVGEEGKGLQRAIAEDRARRPPKTPTRFSVDRQANHGTIEFAGVAWKHEESEISGSKKIIWLGEPVTKSLMRVEPTKPEDEVTVPAAYWVPANWTDVIERLAVHGIEMEQQTEARTLELEVYRVTQTKLAEAPFEGHVRVELEAPPEIETMELTLPAGSMRVPTDQPLGLLAVHLLEPIAPDSFFRWGLFTSILSRTEYVEAYVMEPMAERMLAEDPELAAEFAAKLEAEPEFAADPRERLQWFYRRTPFFDPRWRLYPVGRELAPKDAP